MVKVEKLTSYNHQNYYFLDEKGNGRKVTQKEARDQSVQ